jgi:hypothetical protein
MTSTSIVEGDFVYMLIEREFRTLSNHDKAYKIGQSGNIMGRMRGYPKGSQLLICVHVRDAEVSERYILNAFKSIFVQRADIGREYFTGDPTDMMSTFMSVIKNHGLADYGGINKETNPKIKTEIEIEEYIELDNDVPAETESDDKESNEDDDAIKDEKQRAIRQRQISKMDVDQRVDKFYQSARADLKGSVNVSEVHARFVDWCDNPALQPIGFRRLSATFLNNYGVATKPSIDGATMCFPDPTSIKTVENQYAEWLGKNIVITRDKADYLHMAQMKAKAGGCKEFVKLTKAYFDKIDGVSFPEVARVEGTTARGIVKGIMYKK